MENINFESIKDKRKHEVYVKMWGNNPMVSELISKGYIAKTPVKAGKSYSDNSYCFNIDGKNEEDTLIEIFGIPKENQQLFRDKFAMACSGSGKEKRKITTMHSSSLCALLFFYNVTEKHKLEIPGVGIFSKSVFEFKSKVINSNHPSCMDVVLIGETEDGKDDAILFLESKFSEYYLYASKKSGCISKEYLNNELCNAFYGNDFLGTMGINRIDKEDDFQLVCDSSVYLDGLKQMISHYVGITNNFSDTFMKQKCKSQKEIIAMMQKSSKSKNLKIFLGEILFGDIIGELELKDKDKETYSDKYKLLAEEMNREINSREDKHDFIVWKQDLSYSTIFKEKDFADENVLRFYFGRQYYET